MSVSKKVLDSFTTEDLRTLEMRYQRVFEIASHGFLFSTRRPEKLPRQSVYGEVSRLHARRFFGQGTLRSWIGQG